MSDFNVLLQGTENYPLQVHPELIEIITDWTKNKTNLFNLLIKNIKGKNTGIVCKQDCIDSCNKNYQKILKELVNSGMVRIITNDLPTNSITYQLPPHYVFKGSDGMKALQISDWIDYSRNHNSELIKALPESEREQYQQHTIEQIT